MTKVKRPQDGLVIPKQPILNNEEVDDDAEDEAELAMSEAGLMAAADDLTVKDVFAAIAFHARLSLLGPSEVTASIRAEAALAAYHDANALCLARVEVEEDET